MKLRSLLILLVAIVGIGLKAFGQSAAEDLKSINKAYSQAQVMIFDMTYKVYPDYYSTRPVEEMKGTYKKKDQNYIWETEGQSIIQNGKYFISIDKENKSILVSSPTENSAPFLSLPMDSLLTYCSKSGSVDMGDGKKRISMVFKESIDNVARLEIVKGKDHFIQSILIFYEGFQDDERSPVVKETPRLEIKFENRRQEETIGAGIFSEKPYFYLNGKKIVCQEAFAEYSIIDQRIKR